MAKAEKMNNEGLEGTIHVTAPSILNKPSQTMPQRSPFAIQELLGLGDSQHRYNDIKGSPTAGVSAITPNVYSSASPVTSSAHHHHQLSHHHHRPHHPGGGPGGFGGPVSGDSPFGAHHAAAHMTMAASRMAYFNAQAAVAAAAFLPHAGLAGMGAAHQAAALGLAAAAQQQHAAGQPTSQGVTAADISFVRCRVNMPAETDEDAAKRRCDFCTEYLRNSGLQCSGASCYSYVHLKCFNQISRVVFFENHA
nr:unnamed protein product [Callosobruchus analis]